MPVTDNVMPRSYDSDSGAGSVIDPVFNGRPGFHAAHHDNNHIYEILQGLVLGLLVCVKCNESV